MSEVGGKLGRLFCLLVLLLVDMGLQTAVEVVGAQAGVDNRDHNQNNSNDGEEGHRWSSGQVLWECCRSVHSEQLETKVCHGCEEKKLSGMLEAITVILRGC